ncbi:hypothetical protein E2C01_028694 [Portunus trituberculatus]|uniref:Endonuclease/exonuclease/phosphatase domain-containing protein n=1 Tax=Portunus trituberculatus TaxID=210409 RepID=A0A5B7ESF7_PORTR|nr:hypothetical protein [Portunus trituberculatus]
MLVHSCSHVLIVGNLNDHLERDAYENLLEVQGLTDHVTFPTHERGGTLDPVISGYQADSLQCHRLELMGSSDHYVLLTQLDVGVAQDEATTRTIWLWNKANWAPLHRELSHTPWATLLQGGTESGETLALTSHLGTLERRHAPHRKYATITMVWLSLPCCCQGKIHCRAPLQEEPDST